MNEKKTTKLVFEPKMARKLLKMNGEIKFCPHCGASIKDGCECHKNIVVDIKPMRGSEDASVMVFMNNEAFQSDFTQLLDEMKAKREAEVEPEVLCELD